MGYEEIKRFFYNDLFSVLDGATLVHSIVDRIYIATDGTKQKCQVYIKGCATEDYSDVLGAAGYIEEEPLLPVVSYMPPMCDLDYYSI